MAVLRSLRLNTFARAASWVVFFIFIFICYLVDIDAAWALNNGVADS